MGSEWVLGGGVEIDVVKDPWLKCKEGFKVDQSFTYDMQNTSVANLMLTDLKN